MLKKIMLPVVLLCMLIGSTVVVNAADIEGSGAGVPVYADVNEKLTEMGLPNINVNLNNYYLLLKGYTSEPTYFIFEFDNNDFKLSISQGTYNRKPSVYFNLSKCLNFTQYTITSTDILDGGNWSITNINTSFFHVHYTSDILDNVNIYYSDFDIYTDNKYTDIFFRETPHPIPLVMGMEAEHLAEIIKPEMVLAEVIALLPMTIPVMAGLISFSKGLRLISTVLNQA